VGQIQELASGTTQQRQQRGTNGQTNSPAYFSEVATNRESDGEKGHEIAESKKD
jgi:hypothetical protein